MLGLLYRSKALLPPSEDSEIYLPARRKNRRIGATGFLHREGDAYFQYIEGDEGAVRALADVIAADPRHTAFEVLLESGITGRLVDGQSMGYTFDQDISWREWASARGARGEMWDAPADQIVEFIGSYGDPNFAARVSTISLFSADRGAATGRRW